MFTKKSNGCNDFKSTANKRELHANGRKNQMDVKILSA